MHSSIQSRAMKLKQKQKQRKVKEGDNPFLPQEIITNILKRLPVKSLIRFKCVCKHWKNLIKTPSFVHEHLHHSSNQNPSLLFGNNYPRNSLQLYLLNNEVKVVEVHCASLFDLLRNSFIIGSSNGLLCVKLESLSHPILLWNPAIRQVRLVAKPANSFASAHCRLEFGFNSIVNDYKVVRILNIPYSRCNQGNVYSLKTGSWKEVECSPLNDVFLKVDSVAANGSIFWFGFKRNVEGKVRTSVSLVSFDMAMEVFTLIPSPISSLAAVQTYSSRLTIHGDKLAILSTYPIGNLASSSIDLWVMEDETGKSGERWGWTKKFSVRHPLLAVSTIIWRNKIVCYPRVCYPGGIDVNEGVILDDERKSIVLVNLTTNEVNMFAICKHGPPYPLVNYVESLVPVSKDHIEDL